MLFSVAMHKGEQMNRFYTSASFWWSVHEIKLHTYCGFITQNYIQYAGRVAANCDPEKHCSCHKGSYLNIYKC